MKNSLLFILFFLFPITGHLSAETKEVKEAKEPIKVLAFAGSTRKDSINKKLVLIAAEIARKKGASVTFIDLKEYPIPLYDGDLEESEGMPKNAKYIRNLMLESSAIIIATPEYNGSISAVLKNALDWVSRSEDSNASRGAFKGKKFAVMSTSPSKKGGLNGLNHLSFILENLGGKVVSIKVAVPNGFEAFNEVGQLRDEKIAKELDQEIDELLQK
jgi:chromate reductase, NAD(P)H dehydrogenase (quinone)